MSTRVDHRLVPRLALRVGLASDVARYPGLSSPKSKARLAAMLTAPESFMPKTEKDQALTPILSVRLPADLIARVDAFAEKEEASAAGRKCSRTDAVRMLLVRALDADGSKGGKGRQAR